MKGQHFKVHGGTKEIFHNNSNTNNNNNKRASKYVSSTAHSYSRHKKKYQSQYAAEHEIMKIE